MNFTEKYESEFLTAVDTNHLFVSPGGEVGESLPTALRGYVEEIKTWRSDEHLAWALQLPRGRLLLNALMERIAPQYHLLENAEEMSCSPILCIPAQWHYYSMASKFFEQRLVACGVLNESTINTIRAINQPELKWLGNIPVEALVELRRNNENEEFRKTL